MKDNLHYKVACVLGTRPEVIKMAPIIYQFRHHPQIKTTIICTAQHREMLDDMLRIFGLKADIDLNIMKKNQSLGQLTGQLFDKLDPLFMEKGFHVVLAQGDTTTTWVAAQTCFYHDIPFGHVEAGLRSYDFYQPFPEEMNRVFVGKLATWHFAPTETEKKNLLNENVPADSILVTGNPVIDALYMLLKKNLPLPSVIPSDKKIILITSHRRENFGKPFENICKAILEVSAQYPDIYFVYPVHPNPFVTDTANRLLSGRKNILLLPPLPYDQFVAVMKIAYLIWTDSGGVQEEAPALAKPVLILREKTERPEVVAVGAAKLVGTNTELIVRETLKLIEDPSAYQAMAKGVSPYGDGHAAERIVDKILRSCRE